MPSPSDKSKLGHHAELLIKKARFWRAKAALADAELHAEDADKYRKDAVYCDEMAEVCKRVCVEKKPRLKPTEDSEGFRKFWLSYPRKIGKADARSAWIKWNCEAFAQKVLGAVFTAKMNSPEWKKDNGFFIPHPATWLNREGWEDVYEQPSKQPPNDDPDGWREFLTSERRPYVPFAEAQSFYREKFSNARPR